MIRKSNVVLFALFLILSTMIIAFGQQKMDWKSRNNLLGIKFVEDLKIRSAGEGYSFFAQGLEADSEGNIYILDRYDSGVLKFDRQGKFVGGIGQKGQGPGEYETPGALLIDHEDNLYVKDITRWSLIVFNKNGNFVKNIQGTGILSYLSKVMIDSDLNIICGYQPLFVGDEANLYKISKFDRDFRHISDIYERKGVSLTKRIRTGAGTLSMQAPRYTPEVIWTMDSGGRFYVCYNDSYHIRILTNTGESICEINKKYEQEKISDKEKKQLLRSYEKRVKNAAKYIDFPKVKPPLSRLYIVNGCLFAQKKRTEREYFFDVFDKEGNYIDEMVLDFLPLVSKNNFIYTLKFIGDIETFDITDVEIFRYRIVSNID